MMVNNTEDTFCFQNSKHPNVVLQNLNGFRKDHKLCDVAFICDYRTIHAHKAVMASNSSYFTCMFCSGMKESSTTQIPIMGVDADSFEALVEYCYTSSISINCDNVKKIHAATNIFDFREVQEACEQYLLNNMTVSNCVAVSVYAQQHACENLMEGADLFTRKHFLNVVRSPEFLELDHHHVIRLISHDELQVTSEIEVFNAVISWVNHGLEKRRTLLPAILQHVRLGVISPKLLLDCVQTEHLIADEPQCKVLVDEVTAYHLLPERRMELSSVRTRSRKCPHISIYAVGGENNDGVKLASVERYDCVDKCWVRVSDMQVGRSRIGVTNCNGALYVGGGYDGQRFLNSVERYTPYDDEWKLVAPLVCPRSCMGMVCLGDFVYAIGGRLEDTRLATVERYDCHRDQWLTASGMATSRSAAGVTVIDGCIYVAGGYDGHMDLSTVERYDPRMDKWCQVARMNKSRSLTAAVSLNGYIYVPGGQILMTLLDYVECYDPRNNTWHAMSPLLSSRYGFGAAVIGQQLLVAGGCDGSHRLDSVELYDPILNNWSTMKPMSVQRHSLGVTSF